MKRFARTEQGLGGILWSVYEAQEQGDFGSGTRVASFLRRQDAMAFVLDVDMGEPITDEESAEAGRFVAEIEQDIQREKANEALLVTSHRALLTVNEWLLTFYTDHRPMHPAAHRLLAEMVQAVLNRFKAEGRP